MVLVILQIIFDEIDRLAQLLKISCRCGRYGVRIQGQSNRTQGRQRLATAVTFFWSSVAQALSRRDGSRHSSPGNTANMMNI